MVGRAQTLELPVDHDDEARAQRLALLHAVRGEEDEPPVAPHQQDVVPEEAARARVHAAGRLVQADDGRVADEGDGGGQLALVAAGQVARDALGEDVEADFVHGPVGHGPSVPLGDGAQPGVNWSILNLMCLR